MAASRKAFWIGTVIAVAAAALFFFSAAMKLKGGPELDEGMKHLALPSSMVLPLAILEIACVVVFLVPPTTVLGAILLTGYVGGTIVTHWRSGDPFIINVALGLLIWLSVYLREPRLRELIPVRTAGAGPRLQ